MGRVKVLLLVCCLVMGGLLSWAPAVSGEDVGGTISIGPGRYYGWEMTVSLPTNIDYSISVIDGAAIDVLLIDSDNYSLYRAGEDFEVYYPGSYLNVTQAQGNISVVSGILYLILDNTDYPLWENASVPDGRSSNVSFFVSSDMSINAIQLPGEADWPLLIAVAIGAVVIFVVTVFLTLKAIRGRKKRG